MCASPLSSKLVDDAYTTEFKAASHLTNVHLFDIKKLSDLILPKVESRKLIYHGWMMPPSIYEVFYNKCKEFGYDLINSPDQYIGCHHFDRWYPALKYLTPESIIVEITNLRAMTDQVARFMLENDCGVFLKDYVKSIKHYWYEAAFIPKGADFFTIAKVLNKFFVLKELYDDLQGNLVVRKFVPLKVIGKHEKSEMPIVQEFRTFVIDNTLLPTYRYWSHDNYSSDTPAPSFIETIANKIYYKTHSKLFTVDVAQLESGSWICIEVGDGQVSAIPEHENRPFFFEWLLHSAEKMK